tara:strand:+ start:1413 stop:1613 length:201 start_codon:yes stop_codon:yes gene_type:complete
MRALRCQILCYEQLRARKEHFTAEVAKSTNQIPAGGCPPDNGSGNENQAFIIKFYLIIRQPLVGNS